MKKIILLIALACIIQATATSQSCLPDGITITTQAEIDSFQINYPYCTEIEGDVDIKGWFNNVANLNGLNVVNSIGGNLKLLNCDSLISLEGLENLISIGGNLIIGNCGDNWPNGNSILVDFTGLEGLTSIGGDLEIGCNESLQNIDALSNLNSIGDSAEVTITSNPLLFSLSGLNNLNPQSISNLNITYNTQLSICNVQSICEYLSAPQGEVRIYKNGPGCSLSEIVNGCGITLPCLPYGYYYFDRQADINDFEITFPGCTELEGDVSINGIDITNLDGLNVVTSIGGELEIGARREGNPVLTELTGLNSLTSCGSLYIHDNQSLNSIIGLEALTSICGSLVIKGNPLLTNIAGLANIEGNTIEDIYVKYNYLLSNCEISSICEYLASPSGEINIGNNASGCNSEQEVLDSCDFSSVIDFCLIESITVSPNPFTASTTIEYELNQPTSIQITIYNHLGKQVEAIEQNQSQGKQQVVWNAEGLPAGVYFCVLKTESGTQTMKMIKL